MNRPNPVALGLVAALLLTTWITTPAHADGNAAMGTVFGGVVGGLIGNSLGHGRDRGVATLGGAVVGAVIGNSIGQGADREFYGYRGDGGGYGYSPAYGRGYDDEYDEPARAYYPPPRVYFAASPPVAYVPAYAEPGYAASAQQAYCREYITTVVINGRAEPAHGTACLQPDGSWQAVR